MGFLHRLWDETLAGPAPDSGLGKLRKYHSFSGRSAHAPPTKVVSPAAPPTRSLSVSVDTAPSPSSPFSPSTPRTPGSFEKLTRRKLTYDQSKSPTGYDWIVLSALDRC